MGGGGGGGGGEGELYNIFRKESGGIYQNRGVIEINTVSHT